jgi:hypothetical protein
LKRYPVKRGASRSRVELARFVLKSMGIASLVRDMRDPDTRRWWHIMNKPRRKR